MDHYYVKVDVELDVNRADFRCFVIPAKSTEEAWSKAGEYRLPVYCTLGLYDYVLDGLLVQCITDISTTAIG